MVTSAIDRSANSSGSVGGFGKPALSLKGGGRSFSESAGFPKPPTLLSEFADLSIAEVTICSLT